VPVQELNVIDNAVRAGAESPDAVGRP